MYTAPSQQIRNAKITIHTHMSVLQKHNMIPYNIRYMMDVHCTYEIYIEVFKNVPPAYNYLTTIP